MITSDPFDEDAELEKIALSCFGDGDFKDLTGNVVGIEYSKLLLSIYVTRNLEIMGLSELRKVLNFGPPRVTESFEPWTNFGSKPCGFWTIFYQRKEQLAAAITVEDYYNLIEQDHRWQECSLHQRHKDDVIASQAYFDKYYPAFRMTFRYNFEKIRRSLPQVLDRAAIDHMFSEFKELEVNLKQIFLSTPRRKKRCRPL